MNDKTMKETLGLTTSHLISFDQHFKVHKGIAKDLEALINLSEKNSFQLSLASSFRSFERQLIIWNEKAQGKRVLRDDQGKELVYKSLSEEDVLFSILRWSALPGTSRHHWGTDIDVYDQISLPSRDYQIQLTPYEVSSNGPFGAFHDWLDEVIEKKESYQFFRPYLLDRGGIAPERWHLSHFKVSKMYQENLNFQQFEYALKHYYQELELYDLVWKKREIIYSQYIMNLCSPQWHEATDHLA